MGFRDMFSVPNKLGFEIVMYFLFEKLDPQRARDDFRYQLFLCNYYMYI